jgi:hypothetical protein
MSCECQAQSILVGGPAVCIPDTVDVDRQMGQAESGQHRHDHVDDFGVLHEGLLTKRLDAEAVKFAFAAALRLFISEERSDVVELDRRGLEVHLVFNVRPACCRGPLRTQDEMPSFLVRKRIHLLLDDVCALPNGR